MRKTAILFGSLLAIWAGLALAADDTSIPRPIPLTRPELKELIENMKARTPRIILPELTDEEKAKLGDRGGGYEGRLRQLYMPCGQTGQGGADRQRDAVAGATPVTGTTPAPGGQPGQGGRGNDNRGQADPKMTLDYKFKTQLFWIVSRTNNCQYCLGHQEGKLLAAGMKDDEIAGLDGDWSEFSPAERAAYAFARQFTYEPQRFCDADIDKLRPHYTDLQILEMIMSMAGNNSINRWKEGVGVPQSARVGGSGRGSAEGAAAAAEPPRERKTYLTPTSEKFQKTITKVAPIQVDEKGEPNTSTVCRRPPLESRPEVEQALANCYKRAPRLPLVDEAEAREVLPEGWPEGPLPQWVRLVANFPRDGKSRVNTMFTADTKGDLTPLTKAQVSWIIARQDRAWYAVGQAQKKLRKLGQTDEQIFALDGSWEGFSQAERAVFTVARKLAATPVVLTDDDFAAAVKLVGPRDVVQLVHFTTTRAAFDRITEAAGLQLEP